MTYEEAHKIIGSFEPNEVINSTQKLEALMLAMDALEKAMHNQNIKTDYYQANREKILRYYKDYYDSHKEQISLRKKAKYQERKARANDN